MFHVDGSNQGVLCPCFLRSKHDPSIHSASPRDNRAEREGKLWNDGGVWSQVSIALKPLSNKISLCKSYWSPSSILCVSCRNSSYWASLACWYSALSALNVFILSLISLAFGFKTVCCLSPCQCKDEIWHGSILWIVFMQFIGLNFFYATLLLLGVSEAIVGMGLLISSLLPKVIRNNVRY